MINKLGTGLSTIGELFALLGSERRWWLIPMLGILLCVALLVVVAQAIEYVAPFVYTIF